MPKKWYYRVQKECCNLRVTILDLQFLEAKPSLRGKEVILKRIQWKKYIIIQTEVK